MCFCGYRMFRLSLGIAGGVAGFILGRVFINLTGEAGLAWSEAGKLVALAAFTLVFGILAFTLYMKALIAITCLICGFWFYDDFNALFANIPFGIWRLLLPFAAGLLAGVLIGVVVYFAQRWTISLFTSFVGARVISSALTPVFWEAFFAQKTDGVLEHQLLGPDVEINYTLIRVIVLVAFCAAGFVVQLKSKKK